MGHNVERKWRGRKERRQKFMRWSTDESCGYIIIKEKEKLMSIH